jgi:hypothetical protein
MAIAGAFNGFFQHWHLYHHKVWASILAANGWQVERVYGLGGRRSEFLFRLFLPTAFLAFLFKKTTGYYPNVLLRYLPVRWLAPLQRMLKSSLRTPLVDPDHPTAYEYAIVARLQRRPDGA